MLYKSEDGNISIGDTDMDYIAFGGGKKNFVIIPGLGDGLKTVKGTRLLLARMYRDFGKDHRVYVFSRKNHIENGYSIRDMARDQKIVMGIMGIKNAHLMGISQGGMIAQYMAIDYPEIVDKLVLVVSSSRPNDIVRKVLENWIDLAKGRNYGELMKDTMENFYTEERLNKMRKLYPIMTKVGKPKSFHRFIVQAEACLNHDAHGDLNKINAPTLIIGGQDDRIVGPDASAEMAREIKDSKLIVYGGLGHGAYEEAKDFNKIVLEFLSPA
ncbi:MAG: alpha/beta hydrolase [Tissierellaceae bacterium]|nr:alpha/beta hydrolase [Tissierellaceae bacterium]